jgi:hypothetical protein
MYSMETLLDIFVCHLPWPYQDNQSGNGGEGCCTVIEPKVRYGWKNKWTELLHALVVVLWHSNKAASQPVRNLLNIWLQSNWRMANLCLNMFNMRIRWSTTIPCEVVLHSMRCIFVCYSTWLVNPWYLSILFRLQLRLMCGWHIAFVKMPGEYTAGA